MTRIARVSAREASPARDGAIGLRRVVREHPDKAVESLNQAHNQRDGSKRVARAKPDAT
jgi:hypothetical protein